LFQQDKLRILIATDVIARGIDFEKVSHVINFDMPRDPAAYIHRIGRTGRADKAGIALSFITEKEVELQHQIEELMNKKLEVFAIPDEVELTDELTKDEMPVTRDKNLAKAKKLEVPTGAFHEKKAKNRKEQLGGKRYQESQRRTLAKSRSKRKR
jgi:ATP-dependent RNA helicase RhlE